MSGFLFPFIFNDCITRTLTLSFIEEIGYGMGKMLTLFMVQLGARPNGRLIEQHDIFFGVANQVSELIDDINQHWSEVKNKWHIDSYRAISKVDNYAIKLVESSSQTESANDVENTNDFSAHDKKTKKSVKAKA